MKKNLAVLLLRMAGSPDMPTLDYATRFFTSEGRGTGNLVDYYEDMSHGRLDLSGSRVYDWINYGHTNQDIQDVWDKAKADKKKALLEAKVEEAAAEEQANAYANGVKRRKIVEWARDAAARNAISLNNADVLVCVFNQSVEYFGSPGQVVVNWNAADLGCFSVDLTGVSHEVGHGLGLTHSRMEASSGEYGDQWDIMSAYLVLHFDRSGDPIPPGAPYYTYGPGLNAVNMDLMGWLDSKRVFVKTGQGSSTYSTSFRLRPLHRRDLPGWLAARVKIGSEMIYFEFRMDDGWDIQNPTPCVLLHQNATHPGDGRPCSEILVAQPDAKSGARADLRAGETFEIGDKLDIFGLYARITVTDINRDTQEASVDVYVRELRQFEPQGGLTFGGVSVDGGGYIWVPGRGLVKVPPRSPVIRVLEQLADVTLLQSVGRGERGPELDQLALGGLIEARDTLSAIIESRMAPQVPRQPLQDFSTGSY